MKKSIISKKGKRLWQGIPGIEISPKGRLWATFYSGGPKEPHPDNYILLCSSIDQGETWSEPIIVMKKGPKTRVFDPTLWHDPEDNLWLIYNQGSLANHDCSVWAIKTPDSDQENPKWSDPFKIELGITAAFRMNKPIVTKKGEWMLPVTWNKKYGPGWLPKNGNRQGVAISQDKGESWVLYGKVKAKKWALENMIVELDDGRFWMTTRAGTREIWESYSKDQGRTWSKGKKTNIKNPKSRFFIGKLQSGRLLLVNNSKFESRTGIDVALSEDAGKSFPFRLEIDNREKVSYPDAVQDNGGTIHIVYDRDRYGMGEINYVSLNEKEILDQ